MFLVFRSLDGKCMIGNWGIGGGGLCEGYFYFGRVTDRGLGMEFEEMRFGYGGYWSGVWRVGGGFG